MMIQQQPVFPTVASGYRLQAMNANAPANGPISDNFELESWLRERLTDRYRNDKSWKMFVDQKIRELTGK